jgi:hypothetical protein
MEMSIWENNDDKIHVETNLVDSPKLSEMPDHVPAGCRKPRSEKGERRLQKRG